MRNPSTTWSDTILGDQCLVIAGQSPESKFYNTSGEGLPFYQGKKEFTDKFIGPPTKWTTRTTKEALEGDILMSVRAPVGPINFSTQRICIGRGLAAIRAGKNIDREFLFYVLLSKQKQISGHEGAVFSSINQKQIKNIEIPLPPLPEQKRIVAILDKAFEGINQAIANTEKNLANARELFESYLNDVFSRKGEGWEEKKLGDICRIKHGFAFKSKFFATKGEYVVLTPGSFYEHGGFRDQGSKTKYYSGEIPDGFILNKGNFLIAMTEQAAGLLGSSLIVPESNRFLHNQRLGLVEVNNDVNWDNDFFHHQFNTKKFRNAVQFTASGVKVRHTSPKKLYEIPVSFPPSLSEQKQVSFMLNEIKSQIQSLQSIYQQKLNSLHELKQSILEKAFSGNLDTSAIQ